MTTSDRERLIAFLEGSAMEWEDVSTGTLAHYREQVSERHRIDAASMIELGDVAYYGMRFFFDEDGKLIRACGHP